MGCPPDLGSAIFITRVSWNPVSGPDAIELYNPLGQTFDFSNWYVATNDASPKRIGVPGNEWSILGTRDKQVLRRDEGPGSFTTNLDYQTVLYLMDADFCVRVEQMGWQRPTDNLQPQMCITRDPDDAGEHGGFDWFSSGGGDNAYAGFLHYVDCTMSAPQATTPVDGSPATLAFRGAVPNPLPAGVGALVFSVPGARDGAPARVRLRLVDVAGRARATLLDGPLPPGEHRVALQGAAAGIYYAELEVDGRRMSRPVVVVP